VPWLLLLASLAFAFGRPVGDALRRRVRIGPPLVLSVQFLLAIYGGYFGGAVGIMMMAVWGLLSSAEVKVMNPAKVLLVGAMNAVAVVCFVVAGAVRWPETLVMLVAAALGGYVGATLGRRLPPPVVRWGITGFSFAMTLVFFHRAGWF